MPIIRVKEIRDISSEDRSKRLGELRTELLRLKTMIRAGGTVENPARVKELRKAIAKILTIEHEEKLGIGAAKKKPKKKPKEARGKARGKAKARKEEREMKVTPDIICREFIGSNARISKSSHWGNVGLSGKIVDETRNTFAVLHNGKRKVIAKEASTFQFGFPDGTVVEIDGRILVGRPEDRLKKSIRRLW